MINHYSDNVEKIHWLGITTGASYDFRVCYSVQIAAKKGDIIQASFRAEATTEQSYTVQTGSFIVLGDTISDTTQSKSILPAVGENFTQVLHHQVISGACAYTFINDFTGFVNVIVYSISTAAGAGATIEIMQNYGRLDVLHFCADAVTIPPVLPDGSITLTSMQRQQILSALLVGSQDRSDAAAILQ